MTHKLPYALLAGYLLLFAVCAIEPYDRAVWWAENIPIMLLVSAVALMHRYHRFSLMSYLFMSVLVVLHTIGGHYTFERVPFDLVNDFFGFERNNYDRFAHFSVGFYAYPIAEILLKRRLVTSRVILAMFPIFAIFTVASSYEIFEWAYAVYADASAGIAVLGSQGDVWDAQKDMLSDGLGSIFATLVFFYLYRDEIRQIRFVTESE